MCIVQTLLIIERIRWKSHTLINDKLFNFISSSSDLIIIDIKMRLVRNIDRSILTIKFIATCGKRLIQRAVTLDFTNVTKDIQVFLFEVNSLLTWSTKAKLMHLKFIQESWKTERSVLF